MNIVSLNVQDCAGLSYTLCEGINKYTNHHAVSITRYKNFYLDYPFHIRAEQPTKETTRLIRNADVLHFNDTFDLPYVYKVGDCHDKQVFLHVHGNVYRRIPQILDHYRKLFPHVQLLLSTPNLYYVRNEGLWFPSVIDVDELHSRHPPVQSSPVTVYYSPTCPNLPEGEQVFLKVCEELEKEDVDFARWMNTGVSHQTNLMCKSKCSIYFDELRYFYGVNALEAAAFHMCVLHGLSKFSWTAMQLQGFMDSRFNIVNSKEELKNTLRLLLTDDRLRDATGWEAYDYVKEVHDASVCAERFMRLCHAS